VLGYFWHPIPARFTLQRGRGIEAISRGSVPIGLVRYIENVQTPSRDQAADYRVGASQKIGAAKAGKSNSA